MKRTVLRLLALVLVCLAIPAAWLACTPSSDPGARRYGATGVPQNVPPSAIVDNTDAATGAMLTKLDGGSAGFVPATSSTSLSAGGDCVGTTGALACKQATGSDGGFTINATWLGHLSAAGNGRLEGVAKCSSLGSICTMTFPVPANTHGKIVVEVQGVTGDGGAAVAAQTFTGYVSNQAGTCKTYGLAIAGGTLYATDSGAAGAWAPTVSLSSCNILAKGTNGTDAGTTIDWSATATYWSAK